MALMRRPYRDGIELSILGFGGMVAVGMEQSGVDRIVAESCARGVNYFDVAPFYGDGEAEQKLGVALRPVRGQIFLACKTLQRRAAAASEELERSLRRLQTEHVDLYQLHAVTTLEEVKTIFSPGGAMECLLRARKQGKTRFLGFSAHSVEAALAMLEHFHFDSLLFPVNYVCYARGDFGPQVLARARELQAARIGLKAMALTRWRRGETRRHPKCWYKPIEEPQLAGLALRFALSEDLTAVLPPGEEPLYRQALGFAEEFIPLSAPERATLLNSAKRLQPLLRK